MWSLVKVGGNDQTSDVFSNVTILKIALTSRSALFIACRSTKEIHGTDSPSSRNLQQYFARDWRMWQLRYGYIEYGIKCYSSCMKSCIYKRDMMIGCQSLPGEVGTELVRFSYYAACSLLHHPASSQVDFSFVWYATLNKILLEKV